MIIGLMSDSHDNLPKIKQAVEFFNKKKVKLVLHAGDFVAPFVVRELKEQNLLLINPGECADWLTRRPTIGWINLEEMKAEIVEFSP